MYATLVNYNALLVIIDYTRHSQEVAAPRHVAEVWEVVTRFHQRFYFNNIEAQKDKMIRL